MMLIWWMSGINNCMFLQAVKYNKSFNRYSVTSVIGFYSQNAVLYSSVELWSVTDSDDVVYYAFSHMWWITANSVVFDLIVTQFCGKTFESWMKRKLLKRTQDSNQVRTSVTCGSVYIQGRVIIIKEIKYIKKK